MPSPESHESQEYSSLQEFQNAINRQHERELLQQVKTLETQMRKEHPGLLSHLYSGKQYMNYQSNASIGYEELQKSNLSTFDQTLPGQ
jgi:hypothetical protein